MSASLQFLTQIRRDAPAVVAQCRDGHDFWESKRRTGNWEWQLAAATYDMNEHNRLDHSKLEDDHA